MNYLGEFILHAIKLIHTTTLMITLFSISTSLDPSISWSIGRMKEQLAWRHNLHWWLQRGQLCAGMDWSSQGIQEQMAIIHHSGPIQPGMKLIFLWRNHMVACSYWMDKSHYLWCYVLTIITSLFLCWWCVHQAIDKVLHPHINRTSYGCIVACQPWTFSFF